MNVAGRGRPKKFQDRVRVGVLMERDQKEALDLLADDLGCSRNDLVRLAVTDFLNQPAPKNGEASE